MGAILIPYQYICPLRFKKGVPQKPVNNLPVEPVIEMCSFAPKRRRTAHISVGRAWTAVCLTEFLGGRTEARYFTITGALLEGAPSVIAERPKELDAIFQEIFAGNDDYME